MTRPGPETSRLIGQVILAAVLAVRHRRRRGQGPARSRVRRFAGNVPADDVLAAALALAGPAVAIARARQGGRWRWPATPAGRVVLLAHAASAALLEELLWRAPLLRLRRAGLRWAGAAGGAACFAALHVRRDGPASAPVHAGNAVGWTLSTLAGRRTRWAVLAHAGYDVAALTLRPARPGGQR